MSTRPSTALHAEELSKVFEPPKGLRRALMRSPITEPITAVDRVSFEIAEGEVFGLLGPNGAGKTTLIKMLTTLLRPTSGHANVCGLDVVRDESAVRKLIGLAICEERSFYMRLTGRQNLEFFASLQEVPKAQTTARIDEVLELMDLTRKAEDMFYSYSSGMRQKLSIARSLLSEPRVLFLDEPTKNVDAVTANELKRLVKERLSGGASGRSVVLATHRMEEAEQLCDRIAIINRGAIAFCGTVPALRSRIGAAEECVLRLSGVDASDCMTLARSHDLFNAAVERPGNNGLVELRFGMQPGGRQLNDVLSGALGCGATVLSCDVRERALEDLFLDVVGGEPSAN